MGVTVLRVEAAQADGGPSPSRAPLCARDARLGMEAAGIEPASELYLGRAPFAANSRMSPSNEDISGSFAKECTADVVAQGSFSSV
jgi:hypothetical protein